MNKAQIYALMGIASAMIFSETGAIVSGRSHEPRKKEPVKPPIPKGCKEYTINGITVIASNERNAIRKAAARPNRTTNPG